MGSKHFSLGPKPITQVQSGEYVFHSHKKSSQFNRCFILAGVKALLNGKDFAEADTVYPSVFAFLHRFVRYEP